MTLAPSSAPPALVWGRRLTALGLGVHAAFLAVSIAGTQIGLGLAAAGLLLSALGGALPVRTPLDLPILLVAAIATLSGLLSPYGPAPLGSLTLWRSLLGFWVVFQGLGLSLDLRRDVRRLLFLALSGLALSALVGVIQYRTGFDPVHALGLRDLPKLVAAPGVDGRFVALGFYVSRLTFSHVAVFLLALAGGALLSAGSLGLTPRLRHVLVALTVLGLVGLVLTFARAAWLGLGAAAAVLAFLTLRGAGAKRPLRAFVLACVLLLGLALLHPGVRLRLASAFDVRQNSDRVFLWQRGLEIVRDHPLLGIGFGNYPRVCGPYYDRVDPSFSMRTWAHSVPLSILAETGPLGLLAAFFLLVRAARLLLARRRDGGELASGALAALAALCVVAQVHDVHVDTKALLALWFVVALGARAPAREGATSPAAAA